MPIIPDAQIPPLCYLGCSNELSEAPDDNTSPLVWSGSQWYISDSNRLYYDDTISPISTDNSKDYPFNPSKDQLELIEKAINMSINQLDYIGGEIEEIKKFQELREEIRQIKNEKFGE